MRQALAAASLSRNFHAQHGGFLKIVGTFLGGPHDMDCSMLGSILWSPYLGKLPHGGFLKTRGLEFAEDPTCMVGRMVVLYS